MYQTKIVCDTCGRSQVLEPGLPAGIPENWGWKEIESGVEIHYCPSCNGTEPPPMQCPNCGSTTLHVAVRATWLMVDGRFTECTSDGPYENCVADDPVVCEKCDHVGTVKDFTKE